MLLKLLGFFEETSEAKGGDWSFFLITGVLLVGMVVMMIIPQRKQKKRAEEMMNKLTVGSTITTIGGIVGEVVQMDEKHIWIATGTDDSKIIMQFVRQAIHSVEPAPGSVDAVEPQQSASSTEDEVDEIK